MMMMNKQEDIKVYVMKLLWDGIIMKQSKNGDVIQEKSLKKFKKKLFNIKKFKNYLENIQGDHMKIV